MARVPKKKMSKEEIEAWNNLYEYVRTKVLCYDENQMLPTYVVLRLKGMLNGKFMDNHSTKDMAHYSYEVVLNTFKYSMPDIRRALNTVRFTDEKHKVNYIMRIVDSNINTVYMRMKNANAQKAEAVKVASSEIGTKDVEYKPKKKASNNDRFSDLW